MARRVFWGFQQLFSTIAWRIMQLPKDADHSLVSKKTWAKKWRNGLAPRPRYNLPKSRQQMHPLCRHLQRTPIQKWKFFFQFWAGRLAESVDALNSSLAHPAGELRSCKKLQTRVKKVTRPGLKWFGALTEVSYICYTNLH